MSSPSQQAPEGYKPVAVSAAIQLAEHFEKSMIVVFSYDPKFELTHFTTYGRTPQEKVQAAQMADRVAEVIFGFDRRTEGTKYEDFRDVESGYQTAAIEQLMAAAVAASHLCSTLLTEPCCPDGTLLASVRDACDGALAVAREAQKPREKVDALKGSPKKGGK